MRAFWILLILLATTIGWFGSEASNVDLSQFIGDVSWPNCELQLGKAPAGIVGITGGLANRANPCLIYQAGRYNQLSAYVNTGYPGIAKALKFQNFPRHCGATDNQCLAYNYGYNSGRYDINQALKSGVVAKHWWLDVETENSWDNDIQVNRAALQGTLDVLSNFAGKDNLGFYSYPGQWNLLTGNWHNGYPAWVATGSNDIEKAILACRQSFTGGRVVYGQYTPGLDQNYICP